MSRRSGGWLENVVFVVFYWIFFAIGFVVTRVVKLIFQAVGRQVSTPQGTVSSSTPNPLQPTNDSNPDRHSTFNRNMVAGGLLFLGFTIFMLAFLYSFGAPVSQGQQISPLVAGFALVFLIGVPIAVFIGLSHKPPALPSFTPLEPVKSEQTATIPSAPEPAPTATISSVVQPTLLAGVYTIRVPRSSVWQPEQALRLIEQLLMLTTGKAFCIVADHETIAWQLVDVVGDIAPEVLERTLRAHYPDAEISVELYTPPSVEKALYRYTAYYQQIEMFVGPLMYVEDGKQIDPLVALSQSLSDLQVGERVIYLVGVRDFAQEAYTQGEKLITQSTIHPLQWLSRQGILDAMDKKARGTDRTERYIARDQRVFEDKLRAKLYHASVMVQVDSPECERLKDLLVLVDSHFTHFTRMPYNGLGVVARSLPLHQRRLETSEQEQASHVLSVFQQWLNGAGEDMPPTLILEPRELAALWHLPHTDHSAPRITWASKLVSVPETVVRQTTGVVLGAGKYQGRLAPVTLAAFDRRQHVNLVGKTGTGKSTLLHNLIHQDIRQGAGVAVLDPHGQLVRDVLRTSIPVKRLKDVVLLDLANPHYPPPLNPLLGTAQYTHTLRMVNIIEQLFAGTEQAARMSSYLRAALIPLQAYPHATMRDVVRMFMDEVFREQRLEQCEDPETQDFWDYQFNHTSPAQQRQIAEPIIHRIRPFYANPYLYPILCHPDSVDFQSLIQQRKIILISLAMDEEHVPAQERNLVGALLMSRLQLAGMKEQTTEPYYLYVDEVQNFVTTSLDIVLSEARKYGLSLVIANQFLGQLAGKTLEAVMGNVGTNIVFQCSPDDARALAPYLAPQVSIAEVLDLDRFHAAVKMQVNGQTQPAFTLTTPPAPETPKNAAPREEAVRQHSRQAYTPKSREEVLKWLKERYPRRPAPHATVPPSDEETFYE